MTTRRTFIQVMASSATAAMGIGCSSGSGSKDPNPSTPANGPSLEGVSPNHGRIGDSLTLTGQNLIATSQVFFNTTSATPTAITAATVVVTVPAGLTPGAVSITARVGTVTTNALAFTVDPAALPQLSSVVPTAAAAGTTLQITGLNLTATDAVKFGSTVVAPMSVTASSLQVVVPASLASGATNLVVHTAAGDSNALVFTVTAAPVPQLTSLSPTSAAGGATIQINGSNLAAVATVRFGTTAVVPTSATATAIQVVVPPSLAVGVTSLIARSSGGDSNALPFTVLAAPIPVLTAVVPATAAVGATLQLSGQNLAAVTAVLFGTTSVVPLSATATSLQIVVPAGQPVGATTLIARSSGGASQPLPFTVTAAPIPVLTTVVPATAAIGTTLQLTGQHLAAVDAVMFGTISIPPQSATDTTLQVVVPVGLALGALSLMAHNSGGNSNALPFTVTAGTTPVVTDPILVHVYLNGGNDLLDTLPPTGSEGDAYLKARPNMHINAADTFDTTKGFGISNRFLHASKWWQDGRLALLPGIGVDNPNYSHFVSHDVWNWSTASTPDNTGWLGRWADTAFGTTDVLRGLCIDNSLPGLAQGRNRQLVAVSGLTGFHWPSMLAPYEWNNSKDFGVATWSTEARLRSLYEPFLVAAKTDAHAAVQGVGGGYSLFYTAQDEFNTRMSRFLANNHQLDPFEKVLYPGDVGYAIDAALPLPADARTRIMAKFGSEFSHVSLANELKFIAQMIAADMPTQVYTAELAGFDTHADHKNTHEYLIAALGGCLESFFDQLKLISTAKGSAEDRVIVVVWSEFGRRINESDSGTDHGAGGLAFAVGKAVKGGLYSTYPSLVKGLSDKALDGNLETTINYLRLPATLLEKWLPGGVGTASASLGSADPKYIQPIPFL